MLFVGKISTCTRLAMNDGGFIYEARVRDASSPMALRTPGEVVVWMSEDVRKLFPSGDGIEDAPLTVVVREIGVGKNGIPKIKGQVLQGHLKPEQIAALAAPSGELPTKPAPKEAGK